MIYSVIWKRTLSVRAKMCRGWCGVDRKRGLCLRFFLRDRLLLCEFFSRAFSRTRRMEVSSFSPKSKMKTIFKKTYQDSLLSSRSEEWHSRFKIECSELEYSRFKPYWALEQKNNYILATNDCYSFVETILPILSWPIIFGLSKGISYIPNPIKHLPSRQLHVQS